MTINTTTSKIAYSGDGSSVAFAVPYNFFGLDELEVIATDAAGVNTTLTRGVHYNVTGGGDATGTVTAITAPAVGVTWTISRKTARTQTAAYTDYGAFPAKTHEQALDRGVAISQEIEAKIAIALRAPANEIAVSDLPKLADRASKYLAFDAGGQPIASAAPSGGTPVSAFMATVLDDVDGPAALSTLGFSAYVKTLVAAATAAAFRGLIGSGVGGDAVFQAASLAAVRTLLGLADATQIDQNILTNGGFEIWQASTALAIAASATTTAAIYAADMWCMETGANQACTVARQAGLTNNSQYCARVQRNSGQTGTGVLRFQFPIELPDVVRLRGNVLSFSAQMRAGANLSGTLRAKLLTGTGSEGRRTNAGAYTGEATPLDVALSLTTTTGQVSGVSSACATNITQATLCIEWTPSGTAGAADYFEIDDVMLNIGPAPIAYSPRPLITELQRCQRFYWKILRAFNLSFNGTAGSQGFYAQVWFPVTMRATPSVGSATSGGVNVLSTGITNITQDGFEVQGLTNAAGVAAFVYNNNNAADARL